MKHWTMCLVALALLASPALATDRPATTAPATQPGTAAPAAKPDPSARYIDCIALAKTRPQEGLDAALAWIGQGGGEPASHCSAVALIGLKQYHEAATQLERLADESHDTKELRAEMLGQAGQAWILAGDPQHAYADQTKALQLMPGAPDLLIDRAESLGLAHRWAEALTDLDVVLAADPDRADALVYRASARRFTNDLAGAAADAAHAIAVNPNLPEAWLESGAIKRLTDDTEGARHDWQQVIRLAPASPAAAAARENLRRLDF